LPVQNWDGRDARALLALERLDRDLFRNRLNQRNANDALFGGQVLSQALTAAAHTVDDSDAAPGKRPSSIRWTARATAGAFRPGA
jgi:hypothetical protein